MTHFGTMTRHSSQWAAALLLAACGGPDTEPLDGGRQLSFGRSAADTDMSKDPCWRREKGGWHGSVAHCRAMTPPEKMTGVWVTGFEESSFLPGYTNIPDADDPLRFTYAIELDERQVRAMGGRAPGNPNGNAYLLSFIGRRTRDPYNVDCQGDPYFELVLDRLVSARYLGPMGIWHREALEAQRRVVTVARRHGGRWGELEDQAIELCYRRAAH
jgi:hypothetical protein